MANTSFPEVAGPCPSGSRLARTLLVAAAVVLLGTAWVSPARVWLLVIPPSFLLAAFAAGSLVSLATGELPREGGPSTAPCLAIHLGVGLACLAVLALGSALCGVFRFAGIATLALCIYGLVLMIRAVARHRPAGGGLLLPASAGGLVMGGALLVVWLWATIPPTFFDELEYHLVIPQRVLATGRLHTAPWVFFTLMPHASDLLLAWGMVLGGDLGARAVVFAIWVVCVLGAWGLAQAISGPEPAPWSAALVAAALATSPMLWFLSTLPFAETGLTAAIIVAATILVAFRGETRPWLSFGLVLGLAATVKLAGLYWAVAALAAALVSGWPRRDVFRSMAIILAMLAPWWARAYVHTGNPVYPLAYGLLGGSPWSDESQAKVQGDLPYGTGGLGWTDVLRLPVDLAQHPERFGSASDAGALAIAATCLVLILPVMAWFFGSRAERRRLSLAGAVFVLISGACWVAISPTTRFFAPALVVGLAVLAGLALRVGPKGQAFAMSVLLPLGVWGTIQFIGQHGAVFSSYEVAIGREEADHYLARRLDHFQAARFARETLPEKARVLFIGETRPYYFETDAMAPTAYDHHPLERWVRESSSPETLAQRLADEGFTHVVLNVREFRRLHDAYRVLAFSGDGAEAYDRRLKALPRVLKQMFVGNGVYLFEIPPR